MSFIIWCAAILLSYWALGRFIFAVSDGIGRKRIPNIVLSLVGLGVAIQGMLFSARVAEVAHGYAIPLPFRIITLAGILLGWLLLQGLITDGGLSWQAKRSRRHLSGHVKLHLALATGAVAFSIPFYWLVTTSLKPDERTNMFPPDIYPVDQRTAKVDGAERKVYLMTRDDRTVRVVRNTELEGDCWEVTTVDGGNIWIVPDKELRADLYPVAMWSNYSEALKFLPPEYNRGLRPLWNTVYVTLLAIIGTVLSSSLVAFAFARLRWPGRDMLFAIVLATMMIPPAVTMLPVFLIFRHLDWIDTLRPLWVPAFFGSGFNIFLLRQFFLTIPNELEDAAKIDGCGYFTIYWKIMLPLIKPALAALTIFAFMGNWNNFMGPLIYVSSPEKMTLAYALQLFQGMHGGEPAMMMAAATLVMLPVLAVFFFTQRYMIQGVTLTGIKG